MGISIDIDVKFTNKFRSVNNAEFTYEFISVEKIPFEHVTPHNLHITITIKVLPVSIQTWSFSKHS